MIALVVNETAKVQQEDQRLCGFSNDVFVFDSSSAILKMEWRDLMVGERVTNTAHVQLFTVLVHGPCGDSAAGAVPGVVNIPHPAIGFRSVCDNCYDGGIGDSRVGLGSVVVSEGRSSVECSVAGCLVVTTKAERFLRSVPLLVSTK